MSLQEKKGKDNFKASICHCLSEQVITKVRIQNLHQLDKQTKINCTEQGPVALMKLIGDFKTHQSAFNFDYKFVMSILRVKDSFDVFNSLSERRYKVIRFWRQAFTLVQLATKIVSFQSNDGVPQRLCCCIQPYNSYIQGRGMWPDLPRMSYDFLNTVTPGRSGPGTFPPLNLRLRPFRASRAQIDVGCEKFSNVADLSEPARIYIVSKIYKQIHDVSKFCQQFSKLVVPN